MVFTGVESLELTGYTHAGANSYAFWLGETIQATNPITQNDPAQYSLQYTCFDFGHGLGTINIKRTPTDTARFFMYNKKQRSNDLAKTRHVSYANTSIEINPNQLLMFEGGVDNASQTGVPFNTSNATSWAFRNSGGLINSFTSLLYSPPFTYGYPQIVTANSVTIGNLNAATETWFEGATTRFFGGGGYIGDFKALCIVCELARDSEILAIRNFYTTRYL